MQCQAIRYRVIRYKLIRYELYVACSLPVRSLNWGSSVTNRVTRDLFKGEGRSSRSLLINIHADLSPHLTVLPSAATLGGQLLPGCEREAMKPLEWVLIHSRMRSIMSPFSSTPALRGLPRHAEKGGWGWGLYVAHGRW